MKVFKLLSMALIAISISTSFTACNNDEEPVVPPIEEEYIDVPLKLSIDASIDITDEPISRAGNQNPVYAIEVGSSILVISKLSLPVTILYPLGRLVSCSLCDDEILPTFLVIFLLGCS